MLENPTHIPSRFLMACELCGRALDTRAHGVHQWTAGWVMNRAGGGGHAVAVPQRENRWAHRYCVERKAKGWDNQHSMLP